MDIRYPPNALYKIELWKPNMCIHLYHFWPPLDDHLTLNYLTKWHEKTKEKSNSSLNDPIYHFGSPNHDQRPSCPKLSDPKKISVSTHALRKGCYPRWKKMVRNSFRNRIPSMRQLDVLLGRPIYFSLVGRDWFLCSHHVFNGFQWWFQHVHQVPNAHCKWFSHLSQVLNVFPKMFPIASHFIP
jgi:hypothetical protein